MSTRARTLSGVYRLLTLGLVPAVLAALLLPLQASAAPIAYDTMNEYATGGTTPFGIVTGPDHNIWATAANSDAIKKIDPSNGAILNTYTYTGCGPTGITVGPDQNVWVACFALDQIIRVTTAGVITNYPLPVTARSTAAGGNSPEFLTAGPDGFLWFTIVNSGYIAKMNVTTGSLYEYPLAAGPCTLTASTCAAPRGIAVGPDGNVWFTEEVANLVGRITPSGVISEYSLPTANAGPFGMAVGPDGNLYFAEYGDNSIGRVTLSGSIAEFSIPTAGSAPRMVAVGPDGNLWFSELNSSKIGSMTPDGGFHEIATTTPTASPFGVATGPDGNVWFAEEVGNVARLGARHNALTLDKTAVGFGSILAGSTTANQRVTFTNNGPDPVNFISAFLFNPGLSGPSGAFGMPTNTCTTPIASGASCFVDVNFTATNVPGNSVGVSVMFQTSTAGTFLAPDKQTLTVPLSATVVSAACSSVAISTDLTSPQNVGATVTLTATSAGCPDANPLYRFYLRSPEGVWSIVHDFSTANTFVWNTTGYERGTYLTGVWVKDANSTNTYDAYAFGTFTLALPSCSSVNVASDVASPQVVGTTVNFTASSIGCPSPLYQWFVRDTAGNWKIVPGHDFANSSTTFAWNTSALTEGTYQVGVWVKQVGSLASYDAFAFVTYTLTVGGGHCAVPQLAPGVASPQAAGSSVLFTASSTGCTSPLYRFYIRDLAGTWHVVQDFSTTTTYNWTPASSVSTSAAGTYLVGIWAKAVGSANTYDDFYFLTYTLTSGTPCTVNIAAAPGTGATAGTPVTWTATALNCTTGVKYRFWVNPPGGSFGIVQDYSTTNTYPWTQTVPGTYQVGVWVLQTGSTKAYDAFAFTTFTLKPTSTPQMCSSVGVASDVASPQNLGTVVHFTATANGCSTALYQWWVRDTSANWAIVQDFAHSNAAFTWNTTGLLPGTYLLGVWAKQTGSSASYEAYSFVTYTLVVPPGGGPCTSVGISPSVASPQSPGTTITFTATALGCGSPDYRFFIAPPGGAFAEVQPFGSPNTFVWNTTGLAPGPYQVGVWARQHFSTAAYEAFAFITYQLQVASGAPCSTLAFFPTNGALVNTVASQPPQPVGTIVTWSAAATGCSTAQYQFYVQAPWSSFVIVQAYSTTATATWNTAGLAAGTYRILVLARLNGSASAFDVFAVSNYEIV